MLVAVGGNGVAGGGAAVADTGAAIAGAGAGVGAEIQEASRNTMTDRFSRQIWKDRFIVNSS
jgi:hypothetical protein